MLRKVPPAIEAGRILGTTINCWKLGEHSSLRPRYSVVCTGRTKGFCSLAAFWLWVMVALATAGAARVA